MCKYDTPRTYVAATQPRAGRDSLRASAGSFREASIGPLMSTRFASRAAMDLVPGCAAVRVFALRRTVQVLALVVADLVACSCGGKDARNYPADAMPETDADGGSSDGSSPEGSSEAGVGADAEACLISASNYDQSCSADTDCRVVTSTDYCSVHCLCGGSAINVGALAQFNKEISETPLGSGALGRTGCPCPPSYAPCCRAGKCTVSCF
jgi:hypothetical protein